MKFFLTIGSNMKLHRRFKQPLVYVAGKYANGGQENRKKAITQNIQIAKEAAVKIWQMGAAVVCPHTNTAHFDEICEITHEQYLEGDFRIIDGCDIVYLLPNWVDSAGAKEEKEYSHANDIPVFVDLQTVEKIIKNLNWQGRNRCTICGRIRLGTDIYQGKRSCLTCWSKVADILESALYTDHNKFVKVPRL